jgi:hypothetical protein
MKRRELTDTFTCTFCKKEKPYDEFKKNAIRFSGYASYCLQCHRERMAESRRGKVVRDKCDFQDGLNNLFSTWSKG